jgi:DNA-binding CsgD family transcriptional regulator
MFDRNSVAYRQLVADVADAVIARLAKVADEAPSSGGRDAGTPPASSPGLTKREAAVLRELVAGGTSRSIALHLGISPRTVDVHRARVMRKLGVSGLVELVKVAIERMPPPAGQVEDPRNSGSGPKVPDQ